MKKLIALALIVISIACVFCGCGNTLKFKNEKAMYEHLQGVWEYDYDEYFVFIGENIYFYTSSYCRTYFDDFFLNAMNSGGETALNALVYEEVIKDAKLEEIAFKYNDVTCTPKEGSIDLGKRVENAGIFIIEKDAVKYQEHSKEDYTTLTKIASEFDFSKLESTKEFFEKEKTDYELPPKTYSYPTLDESTAFVEKEFPEYKDSILKLDNQVNLSKDGVSFAVFYENNRFKKIQCKNTNFSSAFKSLSNYFSNFAEIGITQEELESNMKISMQMPKYKSYRYEDDNFEYGITVGLDYVQIQMTSKSNMLKIAVEPKNNAAESEPDSSKSNSSISTEANSSNYDSKIIGGWDYKYAYDINTSSQTTPNKPYVSFFRFNSDGTGSVTIMYEENFGLIDITWEYDYEEDDIYYYYVVYLKGDENEKIDVAFVDGVLGLQKDTALMYYKKQ